MKSVTSHSEGKRAVTWFEVSLMNGNAITFLAASYYFCTSKISMQTFIAYHFPFNSRFKGQNSSTTPTLRVLLRGGIPDGIRRENSAFITDNVPGNPSYNGLTKHSRSIPQPLPSVDFLSSEQIKTRSQLSE